MLSSDLVGTWRLVTSDGNPFDPPRFDEWILREEGTANFTHLGPGTWTYNDGFLTIKPDYLSPAPRRARASRERVRQPVPPRFEVLRLLDDQLDLRYAPDEETRQRLFGPVIRRLPLDAPGLSKSSLAAGLLPWALEYPAGNTATLYLPDDEGPNAPATMIAAVERSLLQVMGFIRTG